VTYTGVSYEFFDGCVDRPQALRDSIVMNFRKTQPGKPSGVLFCQTLGSGVGLYYLPASIYLGVPLELGCKIKNEIRFSLPAREVLR